FGIFAALAEFERELIAERTIAGLASAPARRRKIGPPLKNKPANPVSYKKMTHPTNQSQFRKRW
ncbi:recombinase family protein, partial [Enterobacter hormaechei]